ncbi:hypothetical protein GCM10022224_090120 [Nonomuraea antimicrobica]|uniref:Uncharacterized protein n=1 Tax=Nonomuraea antimicrobica TaxID=561173 RepID=A0ABP7DVN9_9ACTN
MATRINRGLSRQIAALVARRVDQVAEDVAQGARHNAPAAKTWITDADEQVRPSHAQAHGQTIPANLDFRLPAMEYLRKGRGLGEQPVNPCSGWKLLQGVHDLRERLAAAGLVLPELIDLSRDLGDGVRGVALPESGIEAVTPRPD